MTIALYECGLAMPVGSDCIRNACWLKVQPTDVAQSLQDDCTVQDGRRSTVRFMNGSLLHGARVSSSFGPQWNQ